MTAVVNMHQPENWDDDFEFQQTVRKSPRKSSKGDTLDSDSFRVSTASSYASADWDTEQAGERPNQHGLQTPPKKHIPLPSHWIDSSSQGFHAQSMPENWDDDFEDKTNSPPYHASRHNDTHSPRKHANKNFTQPTAIQERWDEDFDHIVDTSPSRIHPGKDFCFGGSATNHDIDEDDDNDFGLAEKDEDKTVTARSRRVVLTQINTVTDFPPPVPPIPPAFSTLSPSEQPFPRSPTASVFSVPTVGSGRDSVAYSYYHNNSTTHLRPTISRSSMGGFANLPPSPPIHRERRRLRKKSRPPEAISESVARNTNTFLSPESQSSDEASEMTRAVTPPVPHPFPDTSTPQANSKRSSLSGNAGQVSPASKSPLLSRIGSVKRWGVRKKRASSTPSETLVQDDSQQDSAEKTPRPTSSHVADLPKSGWFQKSQQTYSDGTEAAIGTVQHSARDDEPQPTPESPAKLIKRKSFGFIPLRRGHGLLNGNNSASAQHTQHTNDLPRDLQQQLYTPTSSEENHVQVFSSAKSAPYGSVGMGRAKSSRTADRPNDFDAAARSKGDSHQDPDQDGSRNLMGNLRRLSLTARHKRTKSGASLTGIPDAVQNTAESDHALSTLDRPPFPLPMLDAHNPSELLSQAQATSPTGYHPPLGNAPPISSTATHSGPQTASLGRSSQAPAAITRNGPNMTHGMRRNSLGDLKIPARISQAQVGLRRDLGMVKQFAGHIEQLKELQSSYHSVVGELNSRLNDQAQQLSQHVLPRALSPGLLGRAKSRSRSNTTTSEEARPSPTAYKQLASSFYTINSKYRIAWECAELLIELAGGSAAAHSSSGPSTSISAPAVTVAYDVIEGPKGRERAITLSGDEPKPSPPPLPPIEIEDMTGNTSSTPLTQPNAAWRASTGRHDLNQRQLALLREMLNNPDSSFVAQGTPQLSEDAMRSAVSVNREWRWGDAMTSTVTLPSEDSSSAAGSPLKPRRKSRLQMAGLRDLLRSMRRVYSDQQQKAPRSTVSLTYEASADKTSSTPTGRRRAKTSSGPEHAPSGSEKSNTAALVNTAQTPRRPSLASIFRIGQKGRTASSNPSTNASSSSIEQHGHGSGKDSSTGEEEDWDYLDGEGEVQSRQQTSPQLHSNPSGTVRGRSPYTDYAVFPSDWLSQTPKRIASNSSSSIIETQHVPPFTRSTRLSNVEEHADDHRSRPPRPTSSSRQPTTLSRTPVTKTGSVRSMPPQSFEPLPDLQLAMTPQNIKPLLENAREVHARLTECVNELRSLLLSDKG